ncbi:flavodoxin family protein [Sphingobium sp.]|uniref:flavodoxin family protein n=1 Tax=Sphingobium sp. TaxID=1912891 RepID=UPI0028BDEF2E|nr:flavodoxin family protein [Sphingobium sp.]
MRRKQADETTPRKGMPDPRLNRTSFLQRFRSQFQDPVFDGMRDAVGQIAEGAWDAYSGHRKSPRTQKAGAGYADPDHDLAIDWIDAAHAIDHARAEYEDASRAPRILIVNGSSRSDHSCPGEMSKSWRLTRIAADRCEAEGIEPLILDLSRLTSEYGRMIHPCKACFSTSPALCHWPCSCYPNYSLGQVHDWMNEIYPLWVAAHGVLLITPVNWYQPSSPMKLMMDRLVCADGGNPDPTRTHGKNAEEAKAIELAGWDYPRHLAGRLFGVIVHGDTEGAQNVRRLLTDWMQSIGMISAGAKAEIDRYVGYYEAYATSHAALDEDMAFQAEVANATLALCEAVAAQRAGRVIAAGMDLEEPRPK